MGYSNAVQWGYDDENNLSSQTQTLNGNTYTTQYTYDKDNRLTKTTVGNISAGYTYDAYGRMTGIVTKNGDSTVLNSTISYNSPSNTATSTQVADWNDGLTTYSYIYNDNGNIASISSDNRTATYEYDALNRLTRANDPIAEKTWVYSYDSGGNILKRSEYAYTANALGTPSEEVTYTYGDSQWKDLLTAYNGKPITYDEIGNPLTYDGWTYTWQHGRQLVGMEKEGTSISYAYNASGQRISKTVNGTTYNYHYLGDQLVEMAWGANRMHFTYDAVGPLSVNFNGSEYFYLKNAQGDVTGLADSTGAKVVAYTYGPWGEAWGVSGTLASTLGAMNPLRYRGYVYDTETGLYYLNSRYYNPVWGRFINADEQLNDDILGNNMFAYCSCNPISRADNSGKGWVFACAVVGLIAGGVTKIISNVACGKKWNDGVIGAAVGGAVYGIVAATTGNVIAAGYASAAAESLMNQVLSYVPVGAQANGQVTTKKVTKSNVASSVISAVNDTAINGAISAATGAFAGKAVPINNGWFKPKNFISCFAGKYARKSELQTVIQSSLLLITDGVKTDLLGDRSIQAPIISIFPATE